MRGQAAVMDGLIFLTVASLASVLVLYVAGAYAESSNRQMGASFSNEFASEALITMQYATDANGDSFWLKVGEALAAPDGEEDAFVKYVGKYTFDGSSQKYTYSETGPGYAVWEKIVENAPTRFVYLCFSKSGSITEFCYPGQYPRSYAFVYSADALICAKVSGGVCNLRTAYLRIIY